MRQKAIAEIDREIEEREENQKKIKKNNEDKGRRGRGKNTVTTDIEGKKGSR